MTYKSKRQQINDLCDALEFPVFFPDDLEIHDNKVILKRSDGYTLLISLTIRPTLINDNGMIELKTTLTSTGMTAQQSIKENPVNL